MTKAGAGLGGKDCRPPPNLISWLACSTNCRQMPAKLSLRADMLNAGINVRFVPVAEVGIGAGYILRSGSEIAASFLPF